MSDRELEALLTIYESGPSVLSAVAGRLPAAGAVERPESGEWSAAEIAAHLVDGEEAWFRRIALMMEADHPWLPTYPNADYTATPLATSLERLGRLRAEHLAYLLALDGDDWHRTGNQERWGEITIRWVLAHLASHDAEHLAQLARRFTAA